MKICTRYGWRSCFLLGLSALAVGLGTALVASGQNNWPEQPTYKSFVFPPYFPKNGQGDFLSSGFSPGYVEGRMENFYEEWWRETSYYKANPTNGANVNGYYMDTKSVGEVKVPWAWNPGLTQTGELNINGEVVATTVADINTVYTGTLAFAPVKGRPLTFQCGTRYLTDSTGGGTLGGDGIGTINHSTGAYSFRFTVAPQVGAQVLAYYTRFVTGAAADPGAWANFSAPVGCLGDNQIPDGQGEHFDERVSDPLNPTPAVKYRRLDAVTGELIDDPLVDGFWTPGERFTDNPGAGGRTPPNGQWDPYIHAEDRWTPVHSVTGIVELVASEELLEFLNRGDVADAYADYDFNTRVDRGVPPRVTGSVNSSPFVMSNVKIWIADIATGTNVPFYINELDLTPPKWFVNGVPFYGMDPIGGEVWADAATRILEGDAAHTYVRDNTTPPPNLRPVYADVPQLGRFEYEIAAGGQPFIYRSPYVLETYVFLAESLIVNAVASPNTDVGGVMLSGGELTVVNSNSLWSTLIHSGTNQIDISHRIAATIRIPIYYSIPLWGAPQTEATYLDPPRVTPAPIVRTGNIFLDAVGNDDQPTPAIPAEPFTDFICWWDPVGGPLGIGIWVPGVFGTPVGTVPRGTRATADYIDYNDPANPYSYSQYIWNNYPGLATQLAERCGNDIYDGPENWAEVDNNQMLQTGFTGPRVWLGEGYTWWNFAGADPNVQSYAGWWTNRFHSTPYYPISLIPPAVPNVAEWKPQLTDDNQVIPRTVTTNMSPTGAVVTVTYGAVIHPPLDTTWTYDSPREFCDLASSRYHNPDLDSLTGWKMRHLTYNQGAIVDPYSLEIIPVPGGRVPDANPLAYNDNGDTRLGEPTSPNSEAIYGQDVGDCLPDTPDLFGDAILPLAGPYAVNTHGNYGYDSCNQLNLEWGTWRRNGRHLTGPRGGHFKGLGYDWHTVDYLNWYAHSVKYAADHRDVNLNGLIDQGSCIPAGSQNSYRDADPGTIQDDGMNTMPLFSGARLVEDEVDIYDSVEDFESVTFFQSPSAMTNDFGLQQPTWFAWSDGMQSSNLLQTIVGHNILYADLNGDGLFTSGRDAVWIDYNDNNRYDSIDSESLLNNPLNGASDQEYTGGIFATASWADLNGNSVLDIGYDLVWLDTNTDAPPYNTTAFNTEPVLYDSGLLAPDEGSTLTNNLRSTHSIYVYPTNGAWQVMWAVTNAYVGATELYNSTNGLDLIYVEYGYVMPPWGGFTGRLWSASTEGEVRYVFRPLGGSLGDPGYRSGEDVFIDLNHNGLYDADAAVSAPGNQLRLSYTNLARTSTKGIAYLSTNSAFTRATSVAWVETINPNTERNGETLLSSPTGPLANNTLSAGDISAYVQWLDLPGTNGTLNGVFDPLVG
ncbi:MAG: hypothetical protein H7831_12865, partial [Magnetococcus sp. WYHC-3]